MPDAIVITPVIDEARRNIIRESSSMSKLLTVPSVHLPGLSFLILLLPSVSLIMTVAVHHLSRSFCVEWRLGSD